MTNRRTFLSGLTGFAGTTLMGSAQAAPSVGTASILAHKAPFGRFGFILIDADSGAVLDEYAADDLFIPASLAKIPTSLAVLKTLGAERTFSTGLKIQGSVSEGILNGDLYLVGSGDPSLDLVDLVSLSRQLRSAGIHGITGRFLYDDTALPRSEWLERSQPWQASYNPSLGGLNLNYNRVQLKWARQNGFLRVRTAAVSDGKISTAPSVELRVTRDGPEFAHQSLETREIWSLSQSVLRNNGQRWLPIRRPGAFSASILKALCGEIGTTLPDPVPAHALPPTLRTVAAHESRPMFDLVRGMLKYSTNLTAEALGTASAIGQGASPGNLAEAASVTSEMIGPEVGRIGGQNWSGFSLANHSGLSIQSRATPRQIAYTLRTARHKYGLSYVDLFNDRSLNSRLMGLPRGVRTPAHRITAKTGTMHFVRGFAGYLRAGSRSAVFAFMANDDASRAALDASFSPFADTTPRGARLWLRRAKNFEVAMLSDWVNRNSP